MGKEHGEAIREVRRAPPHRDVLGHGRPGRSNSQPGRQHAGSHDAAKVMVDEIASETPLGRAGGEWGILYACLILQLSYIVVILFLTKPPSD